MGVSTDAILAYGVDLGEDMEGVPWDYWQEGDGPASLEDWVAESSGLVWQADFTAEESKAHWAKKRELVNAFPVEDIYHCSDSDPMLFLAVRGSVVTANRGYPERIEVFPDIAPNIIGYVETLRGWGIDPYCEATPAGWYLMSFWGS